MRTARWWLTLGLAACGGLVRPFDDAGDVVVGDDMYDAGARDGCVSGCDVGTRDAGRAVDAGSAMGSGKPTARADGGPTLCDIDAGIRVRVDPATVDGGFSACPALGMRPVGDCHVYCACWFRNCSERPAYGCVHAGWQVCLDACATFTPDELACRLYRVNNQPVDRHCAEARPRNACP